MKAVFFNEHGPIDVLHYGDVPEPDRPPGWVKLKVRACALNFLDVFTRRGMPGIRIPLPGITGGDCVGEIVEADRDLGGWALGDRCLVNPAFIDDQSGHFEMMGETRAGALAEYCVCRASQLIRIPDPVSDTQAAAIPVAYATAYRMLVTRGNVQPGESVLVLGASGGVGTATMLLAKQLGAVVTAAAGSPEKCERLIALGADAAYDYTAEAIDKYARRVTGSLFRGGGFDVVVNFTGGDTWAPSLRAVKRGGRLLTCGATAGHAPPTDIRFIFMAEMDIKGSTGFTASEIEACLALIADGRLDPVIDRVLPLDQAIEGIRLLEERKVFGKVIIEPGNSR